MNRSQPRTGTLDWDPQRDTDDVMHEVIPIQRIAEAGSFMSRAELASTKRMVDRGYAEFCKRRGLAEGWTDGFKREVCGGFSGALAQRKRKEEELCD